MKTALLIPLLLPLLITFATADEGHPITIGADPELVKQRDCVSKCVSHSGRLAAGLRCSYNECFCKTEYLPDASKALKECIISTYSCGSSDFLVGLSIWDERYCPPVRASMINARTTLSTASIPASVSATPTPPSGLETPPASALPTSTSPNSTPTSSPTQGGGGLSSSEQISLGCALGIGLPTLIIGILALYFQYLGILNRQAFELVQREHIYNPVRVAREMRTEGSGWRGIWRLGGRFKWG